MPVSWNEILVDKVQELACCAPGMARRAVEMFGDDPKYVHLDDKIQVMLDWLTAYSSTRAFGRDFSKAKLADTLEELAGCGAETARRAVEVYADDPMYERLDDKMQVMLDWLTANSSSTSAFGRDFSKAKLADTLQELARCGAETARRAVDILGEDPHYVEVEDKIQVMLDWVSAYEISTAETKNEEIEVNEDYYDLNRRWITDEETALQQLHGQPSDNYSEFDEEDFDDYQHEQAQREPYPVKKRKKLVLPKLKDALAGPPFFYFENVQNMPRGEWDSISRHLDSVEPEFTDSKLFSVCSRPRGYIHNLPTEGRREIMPRALKTIQELIPACMECWPKWDNRTQLNCILTDGPTECVKRKVDKLFELWPDKSKSPPDHVKEEVLKLAKRWNLIWIPSNGLVPLEIYQVEQIMGYDRGHTRSLYHQNDKWKCLGNSFQVHTVGYHLSVLKPLYPKGLKVLSLFAGIGGAEVALQKLGIHLNVVVSVENCEKSRRVLADWWKSTKQSGELILKYTDVTDLDSRTLGELLAKVGGFDLVIGGSPCKNLSGMNRFTRTGLAGESSVLFFEFPRILRQVRDFSDQKEKKPFQ